MILGHFEIIGSDCEIKSLKVNENQRSETLASQESCNGNSTNGSATIELNQIGAKNRANHKTNDQEEERRSQLDENCAQNQKIGVDMESETSTKDIPRGRVPGSTASPTSPRPDPAQTHTVTQEGGRRTSDEGVATLPSDDVTGRGRSPDVAWRVKSVQPEAWSSCGAPGTQGCRSKGEIKNHDQKDTRGAGDSKNDVELMTMNQNGMSTNPIDGDGQTKLADVSPIRVNAVTPIGQSAPESSQQPAISGADPTVQHTQPAGNSSTPSDDQHEWDELTFRRRVEAALLAQKVALDDKQRDQLLELLVKHKDLWIAKKLGRMDFEYDIEIPSWVNPTKAPDRRWSKKETEQIKSEIDSLLKKDFIEPARSPWASRLVLVTKPDGSTRVCVDYRGVNKVTINDAYPTPRIEHILEKLNGNVFFSTFDCEKGYYQVGLSERTKNVSAFVCPFGQFRWTKMPFGLKNAPAVFQRLMDLILTGLSWECCMVFFDDIVVFSKTWEDHVRDLDMVFTTLGKAGMTLNFKKSVFAQQQLVYLGFLVNHEGLRPNPRKAEAVQAIPVPKNVGDLRTFLGMTSYFRRFILNYARVAKPLNELVRKGSGQRKDPSSIESHWKDEHQQAFEKLKAALVSDTMLIFPDLAKEFVLECDASDGALGAVLLQKDNEGRLRPVEYASRLLSPREQRWTVTEREGLASVWGVRQFRHYLHCQRFKLIMDHSAITCTMNQVNRKAA